jgi:hypothetical protein
MTASIGSARAVLALAGLLGVGAAPQPIADAMPEEPIAAIVNAFETHQLVALGDPHGNEQVQKFLTSLIRDPRFSAAVNDIVVEFGNARIRTWRTGMSAATMSLMQSSARCGRTP